MLMIPELFLEPGKVLYVGAYDLRFAISRQLHEAGNEITVLEVWPPFIERLKASPFNERVTHYVEGDVTIIEQLVLPHDRFDYTVWLHGPEHIGAHQFIRTVDRLEFFTSKIVIMATPWGFVPHRMAFDNPHTQHRSYYHAEYFQALNYRTAAIGQKHAAGSHLLAWKRLTQE